MEVTMENDTYNAVRVPPKFYDDSLQKNVLKSVKDFGAFSRLNGKPRLKAESINEDIKSLDTFFQGMNVTLPFSFEYKKGSSGKSERIEWSRDGSNGRFRLNRAVYRKGMLVSKKPLLEEPLMVRMDAFEKLPKFVKAFSKKARKYSKSKKGSSLAIHTLKIDSREELNGCDSGAVLKESRTDLPKEEQGSAKTGPVESSDKTEVTITSTPSISQEESASDKDSLHETKSRGRAVTVSPKVSTPSKAESKGATDLLSEKKPVAMSVKPAKASKVNIPSRELEASDSNKKTIVKKTETKKSSGNKEKIPKAGNKSSVKKGASKSVSGKKNAAESKSTKKATSPKKKASTKSAKSSRKGDLIVTRKKPGS